MPRPIKWHDLATPEDYDLYCHRNGKTWDIMWSVSEGWVIKSPTYWATLRDEYRYVVGKVPRAEAVKVAEQLIATAERWK